MKSLRLEGGFKRDLKRIVKRNYDLAKLESVIRLLRDGKNLPEARPDHALKGQWRYYRECHIAPDWLLIFRTTEQQVVLARTGTHGDLFE
jgi:mRNA interferase YafQ